MNRQQVREKIIEAYQEVISTSKSLTKVDLTDDTKLFESGLDSLGFAILFAKLHDDLGWDPFSLTEAPFEPETFGDFVAFYADNQP